MALEERRTRKLLRPTLLCLYTPQQNNWNTAIAVWILFMLEYNCNLWKDNDRVFPHPDPIAMYDYLK
mgnify:CR=1 FL=1